MKGLEDMIYARYNIFWNFRQNRGTGKAFLTKAEASLGD
jgi:hypothetical protein